MTTSRNRAGSAKSSGAKMLRLQMGSASFGSSGYSKIGRFCRCSAGCADQDAVNSACNFSGAKVSPTSIRLFVRPKLNKRALPLTCCTSNGCCKISTSVAQLVGRIHWQIQPDWARWQRAQSARGCEEFTQMFKVLIPLTQAKM